MIENAESSSVSIATNTVTFPLNVRIHRCAVDVATAMLHRYEASLNTNAETSIQTSVLDATNNTLRGVSPAV